MWAPCSVVLSTQRPAHQPWRLLAPLYRRSHGCAGGGAAVNRIGPMCVGTLPDDRGAQQIIGHSINCSSVIAARCGHSAGVADELARCLAPRGRCVMPGQAETETAAAGWRRLGTAHPAGRAAAGASHGLVMAGGQRRARASRCWQPSLTIESARLLAASERAAGGLDCHKV